MGDRGGTHETEATRGRFSGFLGGAAAVARVLVDHVGESLSNGREIKRMAQRGACQRFGWPGRLGGGFGCHEDDMLVAL